MAPFTTGSILNRLTQIIMKSGKTASGTVRRMTLLLILLLAVAALLGASNVYAQAPANYFVPQTFATFSSPSAGTLDGNAFTVTTSGTFDNGPTVRNDVPGSLPSGTGFPASAPDQLSWGSTDGNPTIVTFDFASPLTRNCHIYFLDVDENERLLLTFFDSSGVQIASNSYFKEDISTTGLPTVHQTGGTAVIDGSGSLQDDPTIEFVPTTNLTSRVVIEGSSSIVGGGINVFFACSKPALSKSFSPDAVVVGQATTLTFDIAVYENPLNAAGFVDTLPSGLEIADPPNISQSCDGVSFDPAVTAQPGEGTITYENLYLPPFFETACTVTVDVVAKEGQTNLSCDGNPPAFTNGLGNVTSSTLDTSSLADACLTVSDPNAVDLAAVGAQAGTPPLLAGLLFVSLMALSGLAIRRENK